MTRAFLMSWKVRSLSKNTDLITPTATGADALPSDAFAWLCEVRGLASEDAERYLGLQTELDITELGMTEHEVAWVIDIPERRLIGLSPAAASVYGRPLAELLERPGLMWEAVLPEDHAQVAELFTRCDEDGAHVGYYRILRADGSERHISDRAIVVYDDERRPLQVKGMQVDVTDEKLLTATLDLYRMSIDSANDAVFIMDRDFRVLEVNEAACQSLGYYRRELLGQHVTDFEVDVDRDALDVMLQRLRRDGNIMFEGRHRTREGRTFPVEISANLCRVGEQEFISAFARDITKRRDAEQERRERIRRLQRHKEAFVDLVADADTDEIGRQAALDRICTTAARALEIARVSIWLADEADDTMTCNSLHCDDNHLTLRGQVIPMDRFPAFRDAVLQTHVVDAHAAMTDPRTRELVDDFLRPQGVTSLMTASVRMSGCVAGVVIFSHVGPPRTWSSEEAAFANTISEHVAHLLEREERKEREAELGEERRRLQTLIRSLPGMVFRIRATDDWEVEFISEGSTALTGWCPEDLIGNRNVRHIDVVHPDDQTMVWETMSEALRNRHAYEVEYRIITKQGEEKWVWEKGQGVYDDDGRVIAAEGFVTDITDRIFAEKALRDSDFRHRELFNNMSSGVAVFETADGETFRCKELNVAGRVIDGLERRELGQDDARELFTGLESSGLQEVMRGVWTSGDPQRVEAFVYRDDWGESWREAYVYKLPGGEVVLVYEDVTEAMSRQSDLRLKQFSINRSSDAIFWIARDGSFLDVNDTACSHYGYSREQLLAMSVFDLTSEYTAESWGQRWLDIRERGFLQKEGEHLTREGEGFPADISLSYLEFEGMEYLVALVRDITARKEAEEHINQLNQSLERRVEERTRELHDSREKYRLLIESLREKYIFYSLGPDGIFTYLSPSVKDVLGYEVEELGDREALFRIVDSESSDLIRITGRSLRGEKQPSFEVEIRHKSGEVRLMDVTQVPVFGEDGKVVSVEGIAHDITEHKRNLEMISDQQEQLMQSEKMAALGSLVAGVAHEINTPVGIGVTAASHLDDRIRHFSGLYEDGQMKRSDFETFLGESAESTRMIMSNLDKAANLIQGFKGVAVDQAGEGRRLFNLRQYLDEIMLSLRPELKRTKHEVVLTCPSEIMVDNYPGAISHTITNLVMNSLIHGFPDTEAGLITIEATSDGETAMIRYADDGVGMNREIRRRIFDPFFTTRRGQGGSGLGMHVVYNSVTESLGGSIICASNPGEGTTFTIEFPLRNGSDDDAAR